MTVTELQTALDRHGPDLAVWPSGLAEDAIDLISVSDVAKDLFAAATETALGKDRRSPAPHASLVWSARSPG